MSLLLIDPIVSAVAGDMHRANDVRRSLQAVVDFAEAHQCAVIGITHFAQEQLGDLTFVDLPKAGATLTLHALPGVLTPRVLLVSLGNQDEFGDKAYRDALAAAAKVLAATPAKDAVVALADVVLAVPQIPVLNNVDVAVQQDADAIRDALYRQAFGPVRWVECVQAIKARGVTHIVECGPGKVLAGMVKRIDADLTGVPLFDAATLADVKELLA
mgnify:CR=1 FL=1